MLIHDQSVFLHMPKTAGSSFTQLLLRYRRRDGPNAPKKVKLPDGSKRLAVTPAPNRYTGAE